jgi:adenosylhomocysteine nucleosidase
MEGASIGHVCYQNSVPFCIIRAISDNADGEADMDFPSFAKKASQVSTQLVLKYLEG